MKLTQVKKGLCIGPGLTLLLLLLASSLQAGEVSGYISHVENGKIHILLTAGAPVRIGDRVRIGSEVPGMGTVFIDAEWRVVEIGGEDVVATSETPPPTNPRPGYQAVITTSGQAQPRADADSGGSAHKKNVVSGDPVAGESVFSAYCLACHVTGVLGAPASGDSAAWSGRHQGDLQRLLEAGIKGRDLCPPRGGCLKCSDQDLLNAIEFMRTEQ